MICESITGRLLRINLLLLVALASLPVLAQSCFNGPDLDAATRSAIEGAARKYYQMSASGDVAGLKANSIPSVAGNFGGIEQAVVSNKESFAAGQPSITGTYLLDASNEKSAQAKAEFFCGIYNSPDRVGFSIPNLPPGRYAIVIQKSNGKNPITLTLILQEMGSAWKLAGYYPRLDSIGGHDGDWYLAQARDYKSKGQPYNSWLYYLTAWELMAPVNFMSTPQLDKIAEELQTARPSDAPSQNQPLTLTANGKSYRIIEMKAVPVDNNLDLLVRHETPDAANSSVAFQDNIAVIKAIVAKYPELRNAFDSVVARAVDNSGHDYGTLLPMKDIK